jgi:hypothetical protein
MWGYLKTMRSLGVQFRALQSFSTVDARMSVAVPFLMACRDVYAIPVSLATWYKDFFAALRSFSSGIVTTSIILGEIVAFTKIWRQQYIASLT